ncbi:MAG: ATP-binding protein [Desulfobacteraceae bacterium]|nr:ATP-binding protein [Desulfobacteraceae bacterium]
MEKYFNVAGPCQSDKHYMLPSGNRCKGIMPLIDQNQYFVIHAARQSGKTTLLLDLVRQLNGTGNYYALYCTLESAREIIEAEKGIPAIVRTLKRNIRFSPLLKKFGFALDADFADFNNVLVESLAIFCSDLDKPLVILFDEVDCLSNGTLISFLHQLRDGYANRAAIPFVHSVGLIGMRNIRDYKGKIRDERETLGSASPFNIVTKTMTLANFTEKEVEELCTQHTEQTGQIFLPEALEKTIYYTQGQPWLVNAIAREIILEILESDYSEKINADHVEQAVETIIQQRHTHIDSLLERLKEDRVKKVVQPVITGKTSKFDPLDDDFQYVLDLGLLKKEQASLKPSNQIYAGVITRYLSMGARDSIDSHIYPVKGYYSGGKLNMKKLLTDFQQFWRENGAIWRERFQYKEAAPHLVLMAFLQRIVNAGGRISRELASETCRLDICIHYKEKRYPIELKLRYDNKTYKEGKEQLAGYMDSLGCDEGWLVVFDQRKSVSWKKKLFWKSDRRGGRQIHIVGC